MYDSGFDQHSSGACRIVNHFVLVPGLRVEVNGLIQFAPVTHQQPKVRVHLSPGAMQCVQETIDHFERFAKGRLGLIESSGILQHQADAVEQFALSSEITRLARFVQRRFQFFQPVRVFFLFLIRHDVLSFETA